MAIRRLDPRKTVLISAVAACALLGFGVAVPAEAGASGTSISASKTMTAHLVSSHGWTLSKSASPSTLTLDTGQSGSVLYTIGATKSGPITSAYFDGQICVRNTGSVATQGLQIVDSVSKPPSKNVLASTVVDVSANSVLTPGESHCYSYRVDLSSGVVPGATYKDTAKVSITNKSGKSSGPAPSATTTLPTTVGTVNNEELTVVDSADGSGFIFSGTGTATYSQSFTCPADEGTHTNTVSAQGFVSGGGVSAPAPATATVTVSCLSADVSVVKVADAASVDAGDPVGFTVTVVSGGSGSATGVSVNDPLPAGVNWSLESQSGNECSITGPVSAQVLSCTLASMAAGTSYSVHVSAVTGPADCGLLSNTATVSATNEPVSAQSDNSSSDSVTISCPDLSVVKIADDDSVDAGDTVGFTVTVSNGGPGTAIGVSISDPLPGDVNWSIESQAGNECSITGAAGSQVLSCTVGDLASGASFSVHVVAPTGPGDCGLLSNTATATATNDDVDTSTDTVTIACPDLSVVKIADDDSVDAGDTVGFTVTVSNGGSGTAIGVSISDPLPGDVNWSIESQAGNECSITGAAGSQVLSCTVGDLASGASFSVHVVAPTDASDCGLLSNTATVSATNDPGDTSTDSVTVQCPDLSVFKIADADAVNAGESVGFAVTVVNSGFGTANGVTLIDPLPGQVNWSIDSQTSNMCSITGGVGSQVLSCTIGSVVSGGAFSVHVVAPTDLSDCGLIPNTAIVTATNDNADSSTDMVTVVCV